MSNLHERLLPANGYFIDKVQDSNNSNKNSHAQSDPSVQRDVSNRKPQMQMQSVEDPPEDIKDNDQNALEQSPNSQNIDEVSPNSQDVKSGEEEEEKKNKGCNWTGWIIRILII
jgi:hypothetical protein